MGLKSSGSTWLYNVVIRVLKESSRGRGTSKAPSKGVMAFYADGLGAFPADSERARYLVVKCHEPSAALLYLTRLTRGRLLVTVREPRDAIVSLIQRFRNSFDAALKDVTREAASIVELSRTHETLTLRYEDRFYDRSETIGAIAAHLGVRLSAAARQRIHRSLTRDAVRKRIAALQDRGMFGADPDEFDPRTHWHPGHVGDGRIGKFSVLSPVQQRRIASATRAFCCRFRYRPKAAASPRRTGPKRPASTTSQSAPPRR